MSWYVGSPSTLVRKGIYKEELIYVTFDMVLETHFLWWSLVVRLTLCGSGEKIWAQTIFLIRAKE